MSRHTLGPWTAMDTGNVLDRHGNRVARYQDSYFLSEKEIEANGKLIAAAPVMLDALKQVEWLIDGRLDINENGGPNLAMEIHTAIEAAIAKAEGRK